MNRTRYFGVIILFLFSTFVVHAQDTPPGELAAILEVLEPGVEVQRVNTVNPISVTMEAIVGIGDVIRTDETGRARITFFEDGTDTELLPNTVYRIDEFRGDANRFEISVSVLIGQSLQRLNRLIDANSSYNIDTPGMQLGARGTVFEVRVEDSGRSAMLVAEGQVNATDDGESASVEPGFGIRAALDTGLSEVVKATTFAGLDAALDGCTASIETMDDLSINVRLSPSLDAELVGTIEPADVNHFVGVNEGGNWYRIEYQNGYGWILSTTATVDSACDGLRVFPDNQREDASLYNNNG